MFRSLFKWLTGADPSERDSAENDEAWYDAVSEFLAKHLGPEHDMVMHALVPYSVGGGLDLYYFPQGVPGTAIATKELVSSQGRGPRNSVYRCYELVVFTKHQLDLESASDPSTPFGKLHSDLDAILNLIARYSVEAKLDPCNTCEFPEGMEQVGGKCLIFDAFTDPDEPGPKGLGLLLVIEIFRSEMDYARKYGGAQLLDLLKQNGIYPYSDLNRKPVK